MYSQVSPEDVVPVGVLVGVTVGVPVPVALADESIVAVLFVVSRREQLVLLPFFLLCLMLLLLRTPDVVCVCVCLCFVSYLCVMFLDFF